MLLFVHNIHMTAVICFKNQQTSDMELARSTKVTSYR